MAVDSISQVTPPPAPPVTQVERDDELDRELEAEDVQEAVDNDADVRRQSSSPERGQNVDIHA